MKKLIKMLITLSLFLGCNISRQAKVNITAKVVNSEDKPIVGAVVKAGGREIGKTNQAGKFSIALEHQKESILKIEITKDSDLHYFAPYYHNLFVKDMDEQAVSLKPVLYSVPKPGFETASDEKPVEAPDSENNEFDKPDKQGANKANVEIPIKDKVAETGQEKLLDDKDMASDNVQVSKNSDVEVSSTPVFEVEQNQKPTKPNHIEAISKLPDPGIFTFYAFSGNKPVNDATVFKKYHHENKLLCKTNARGRCTWELGPNDFGQGSFLVRKDGFKTQEISFIVKDDEKYRFNLQRGLTIEITALVQSFSAPHPLAGIKIWIDDKLVGKTSKFGFLSYPLNHQIGDMVQLKMTSEDYLPREYQRDIVIGGPIVIKKFFTPVKPPRVLVGTSEPMAAGDLTSEELKVFEGVVTQNILNSLSKKLYSNPLFVKVELEKIAADFQKSGMTIGEAIKKGWKKTSAVGLLDVIIVPTLEISEFPKLHMSMIDINGKTLASAVADLNHLSDAGAVDVAVKKLSSHLINIFPFEGALISIEKDDFRINIGSRTGHKIRPGDRVNIFASELDEYGQSQKLKIVDGFQVSEVNALYSKLRFDGEREPRIAFNTGDLVVLKSGGGERKPGPSNLVRIQEKSDPGSEIPLSQVNMYVNDEWIGASDENGQIYLDKLPAETDEVKFVKYGYGVISSSGLTSAASKKPIFMERMTAFVRIDSNPPGAEVLIDNIAIGKTPISTPIAIPGGFAQLQVKAPEGYLDYKKVIDFDEGTLELFGKEKVAFEKDFLSEANKLVAANKLKNAVQILDGVERNHAQYLEAKHRLGEIFLLKLKDPMKAAETFARVTSEESVKKFIDKRFIGSHINEGIALFIAGDQLRKEKDELAIPHLIKSINVLENVRPYLKYVPKNSYSEATHNVEYHIALAKHKLWLMTNDEQMLDATVVAWENYINNALTTIPTENKSYSENAKIYYKQAQLVKNKVKL